MFAAIGAGGSQMPVAPTTGQGCLSLCLLAPLLLPPPLLLVSRPTDNSDGFMWKFCGDKYLPVSSARSEHDFSCAVWK